MLLRRGEKMLVVTAFYRMKNIYPFAMNSRAWKATCAESSPLSIIRTLCPHGKTATGCCSFGSSSWYRSKNRFMFHRTTSSRTESRGTGTARWRLWRERSDAEEVGHGEIQQCDCSRTRPSMTAADCRNDNTCNETTLFYSVS